MNYYNEFDPAVAQWLRQLMVSKLIPAGYVDDRSITEVTPDDLRGFTQCHFFAGIGGWPLALRLAGWAEDQPVWTGSCPCQPFSVAGKGLGTTDERHLWPEFKRLIAKCKPAKVFGEQVASADGRVWLSGVRADLEALGYAVGAADLCAAGIGAPHIRQRLYWVANGDCTRSFSPSLSRIYCDEKGSGARNGKSVGRSDAGGMADSISTRLEGHAGDVNDGNQPGRIDSIEAGSVAEGGSDCRIPNSNSNRLDETLGGISQTRSDGIIGNGWGDHWIDCADGKARRIEPNISPLAHGVPARVVRLRGYGNAIVPQVAAEFIRASWNC